MRLNPPKRRPQNKTPIEWKLGSREAVKKWMKTHTKKEAMKEFGVGHETARRWMQIYHQYYKPQCGKCGTTDTQYIRLDKTGKLNQGLCELCKKMPKLNKGDVRVRNPKLTFEFDIVDDFIFEEVKKSWGNGGPNSYLVQGVHDVSGASFDYCQGD